MTRAFVAISLAVFSVLWFPNGVSAGSKEHLTRSQLSAIAELPRVPPNMNRGFQIVRRPAKRIHASLAVQISTPSFEVDTWIFAMPEPPEVPGQRVLRSETIPPSEEVTDESALRRSVRRCRIDVDTEELKQSAGLQCEYDLQLFARSLTFGGRRAHGDGPERLTADDKLLYLRPSKECDYGAESFRDWKKENNLSREPSEGEIRFAQRVFRTLTKQYRYLYVPKQDRTASSLCQTGKTDCGGLSTLFTSVMRSEGIPARTLSGRWAKSAEPGETVDGQRYFKYHVIAEFYAHGVGWVPVDPSSAILHDRSDTKLKFFGQDPANFVVLHIDTGVEFDTGLYGDYRATYFQIPLFWVRGRGNLEDRELDESWAVKPDFSKADRRRR